MSADRHLLFGLLALQCGFVSKEQLVAALATWLSDKPRSLEAILAEQEAFTPHQLALLKQLEEAVLAQHRQSAEESLAALSSIGSVRQELEGLGDAQLNATLAHVAKNADDTSAFEVQGRGKQTRREGALRYRTIRLHAKGGLGEVFVAKDEELHREVALKEIQERFADHDESRARFKLEAEITGNLEHPGIVPVYGLGQYEDGRPYYAMRFIRGDSLKEAIDAFHGKYKERFIDGEAGLELRKLLRRFVDVCNAMAYAHSRGVLHRDLKPGNIILGKYGETLVVDWGLAKAQGQSDSTDASMGPVTPASGSGATPTLVGSAVGTPAYMSPEQAAGKVTELGPATDVYALGATLFHLLTGQLPIAGKTPLEIVQKAEKGEIRKPRELRAEVPQSLEAVCLKAMAKAPGERYGSPVALAEDIEKWLADEPVSAYVEPILVRARRWVRRHPALVSTSAACVILGLCASLVVAYLQGAHAKELAVKNVELTAAKDQAEAAAKAEGIAKEDAQDKQKLAETERARAEQREQEAIDAVKRFGDAVAKNPELKNSEKLESLRKELLKEPLAFFKSLRERLAGDKSTRPESLSRLAAAAFELGLLTDEIGDKQDALRALEESQAIVERLVRENPTVTKFQDRLAGVYQSMGYLLHETGKLVEAEAAYVAAISSQERLVRENPAVIEYQSSLAWSRNSLGLLLSQTSRSTAALKELQQASKVMERLSQENPAITPLQSKRMVIQGNLGGLLITMGKSEEALAAYEQVKAIGERLVREHPTITEFQNLLAMNHQSIGYVFHVTGKLVEAEAAYEASISSQERLVRENPTVSQFQSRLAWNRKSLGVLLGETNRPVEAVKEFQEATAMLESLVRENPAVTPFQSEWMMCQGNLGIQLNAIGKPAEALAAYKQAEAIGTRLVKENPTVTDFQSRLASNQYNLGLLLCETGKSEEGQAAYEAARSILERLVRENPTVPAFQNELGRVLNNIAVLKLDSGNLLEAKNLLIEAVEHHQHAIAEQPQFIDYRNLLFNSYMNMQKTANGLNDAGLAEQARKGLAELNASDPRFAELDQRLIAVAGGEPAQDAAELLALGQRAYNTQKFTFAARCVGEALERDVKLAESRQSQHAYNAACSAALAAEGQGEADPPLDGAAKEKLRAQALTWLKIELDQWQKFLERSAAPEAKQTVAQTLRHWQKDSDLASVRDPETIAALPEAERKEWEALWARVKEMLEKVQGEINTERS